MLANRFVRLGVKCSVMFADWVYPNTTLDNLGTLPCPNKVTGGVIRRSCNWDGFATYPELLRTLLVLANALASLWSRPYISE